VASAVHWNLCGVCGFTCSNQWWCHQPESVLLAISCSMIVIYLLTMHGIAARWPGVPKLLTVLV